MFPERIDRHCTNIRLRDGIYLDLHEETQWGRLQMRTLREPQANPLTNNICDAWHFIEDSEIFLITCCHSSFQSEICKDLSMWIQRSVVACVSAWRQLIQVVMFSSKRCDVEASLWHGGWIMEQAPRALQCRIRKILLQEQNTKGMITGESTLDHNYRGIPWVYSVACG